MSRVEDAKFELFCALVETKLQTTSLPKNPVGDETEYTFSNPYRRVREDWDGWFVWHNKTRTPLSYFIPEFRIFEKE